MITLGISGGLFDITDDNAAELPYWAGHDAAACLMENGVVIAAVEEERLNRIKHTSFFPRQSIAFCLREAGLSLGEIDTIAYCFAETDVNRFIDKLHIRYPALPVADARQRITHLMSIWFLSEDESLPNLEFVNHHLSHAVSAFAQSDLSEALTLVVDGTGGLEATSVYRATSAGLDLLESLPTKNSLGNFYTAGTELLGYSEFDEYKVMGLAPHGDPDRYAHLINAAYSLEDSGRFTANSSRLQQIVLDSGFSPRRRGEDFTRDHKDLAAALQRAFEELVFHFVDYWQKETGLTNLCLAGGAAHNCTANGKLAQFSRFERIFVHPASHDAGAAVGAALAVQSDVEVKESQRSGAVMPYWGPAVGDDVVVHERLTKWSSYVSVEHCNDVVASTADLLAAGDVIGWVQGRSEFGPRALGNRSIIADARPAENQHRINAVVKKRESYRPFAPAVPVERASEYFAIPDGVPVCNYMSFVLPVRPDQRELLGAITHVDGTARVQTVRSSDNNRFWNLLTAFGERTGTPVLLNTSFNNNHEPIVDSIDDAIASFLTTDLDALVVGNHLVRKRHDFEAALADSTITMATTARLASARRFDRRGAWAHCVTFAQPRGKSFDISAELFDFLTKLPSRQSVVELCEPGALAQIVTELGELWERRYVTITPRQG